MLADNDGLGDHVQTKIWQSYYHGTNNIQTAYFPVSEFVIIRLFRPTTPVHPHCREPEPRQYRHCNTYRGLSHELLN